MRITRISGIELSSACNLACSYCINPDLMTHPSRNAGIMSEEVFAQTLVLLGKTCKAGTQQEVWLNGNGEPLLDPDVVDRVRRTKEVIGHHGQVMMCSNGLPLSYSLALKLKEAGLDRLDISVHSPTHARAAIDIIKTVKIPCRLATGSVMEPHNWAGQIKRALVNHQPKLACAHLIEGRGYVQSEGVVSTCCLDYRHLGIIGSVFDSDILEREVKPYELCDSCHQYIPNRG